VTELARFKYSKPYHENMFQTKIESQRNIAHSYWTVRYVLWTLETNGSCLNTLHLSNLEKELLT